MLASAFFLFFVCLFVCLHLAAEKSPQGKTGGDTKEYDLTAQAQGTFTRQTGTEARGSACTHKGTEASKLAKEKYRAKFFNDYLANHLCATNMHQGICIHLGPLGGSGFVVTFPLSKVIPHACLQCIIEWGLVPREPGVVIICFLRCVFYEVLLQDTSDQLLVR
jgi:hypothetical protein